MKIATTEGIILRVTDYGEADQFVLFLSRDLGKFSALAKHARKSRRRFGTLLQPLNIVSLKVRFRAHSSLGFLEEVRPTVSLVGLYQDWRRILIACCVIDCVHELTREGGSYRKIFAVARAALLHLNEGREGLATLAHFEYQLLAAAGLEPTVDRCVGCHRSFATQVTEPSYWVHAAGGMHCGHCLPAGTPFEVVTPETRLELVALSGPINESTLSLLGGAKLLYHFIRYQIGHPVRSWDYLEKIGLLQGTSRKVYKDYEDRLGSPST